MQNNILTSDIAVEELNEDSDKSDTIYKLEQKIIKFSDLYKKV